MTIQEIIEEEILINKLSLENHYYFDQAYRNRKLSEKKRQKFIEKRKETLQKFNEAYKVIGQFFYTGLDEISKGNIEWINNGILFLEADPYYFRSGYMKEKIIRRLKKIKFEKNQIIRLQNVLINIVKKCFRRELHEFRKLAIVVADDKFIDQLKFLAKNEDSSEGTKIRSNYILMALLKTKK